MHAQQDGDRTGDGDRRAAVADLGAAVRELVARAVDTEVPADELRRVAAEARWLSARLAARRREDGVPSSVDDLRSGRRPFNPATGPGNPVSPPMVLRVEGAAGGAVDDGAGDDGTVTVVGTATLGLPYEGPFGYVHGGVSALLLDQAMGFATAAAGRPGVTGRLQVRYRRPVPLGRPLVLRAGVVDVLGARVAVRGTITVEGSPDDVLVEAEGSFMTLRPEQAVRLFGERPRQPGRSVAERASGPSDAGSGPDAGSDSDSGPDAGSAPAS